MTLDDRGENLRMLISEHREEIRHHEDYIASAFNWSLTIMLGVVAALAAIVATADFDKHHDWGPKIRWGTTILIVVQGGMTSYALFQRVGAMNENARIVASASDALKLFDKDALGMAYPEKWRTWGNENYRATKIMPFYNIAILFLVGLLGILMAWSLLPN